MAKKQVETCVVCSKDIVKKGRYWDGLVGGRSHCNDSWCYECYELEQKDVLKYSRGNGWFSRLPRYMVPKAEWKDAPPYHTVRK